MNSHDAVTARPEAQEVIMATPLNPRPWEQLSELIGGGDAIDLEAYLDELAPDEKALGVSRLDDDEREALLGLLPAAQAASLLVDLPDDQATDLVVEISAADAAEIVDHTHLDIGPTQVHAHEVRRLGFFE